MTAVLRLAPGDVVVAADGRGRDYTVRLEAVGEAAVGTIIRVAPSLGEPPLAITLVQGIPKGDKMEAIVRAATELGVQRVLPAITARTVMRLEPSRWRERARRWQRVAKEATKQCGRAVIPEIEAPRPLDRMVGARGRLGRPAPRPVGRPGAVLWPPSASVSSTPRPPCSSSSARKAAWRARRSSSHAVVGGRSHRSARASCGPRPQARRPSPSCSFNSATSAARRHDLGRLRVLRRRGRRRRPGLGTDPRSCPRRGGPRGTRAGDLSRGGRGARSA